MHFLILLLTLQAGRCSSPEPSVLLQSAHGPGPDKVSAADGGRAPS